MRAAIPGDPSWCQRPSKKWGDGLNRSPARCLQETRRQKGFFLNSVAENSLLETYWNPISLHCFHNILE